MNVQGSVHFTGNLMRFLYTNTMLVVRARKAGIDVLYCPVMEFPFVRRPRIVVTVHDLHPVYFPEQFGVSSVHFRLSLGLLPRLASRIICPSRFVKTEILKRLRIAENRVDVVPLGLDRHLFTPSPEEGRQQFQLRSGLRGPFILFVGSLFPYKNFEVLLKVFNDIRHKIPHTLVIIGKTEVSPRPPMPDERIFILNYVEAAELVKFYSYADMLVHPSLSEGFGLTVLEAMACGTPVISSTAGSLPEVLGDAGIFFDPHDSEALTQSILAVIGNPHLRLEMQRKGLLRVGDFTWESAGRAILASCRKASEGLS